MLYNASGSGKTRILLDSLSRSWGLYFVASRLKVMPLGSEDLMHALESIEKEQSQFPESDKTTTSIKASDRTG
jgi:hypothetical protein